MTFSWNVPGGTEPATLVVRADASPGEVARAALSLLDQVLGEAADALDGPDQGDLRLVEDGEDLVLQIEDEIDEAAVDKARPRLLELGITAVRWASSQVHEVETKA